MRNKQELNALVGSNIKHARERAGLTQERFSDLLGIGPKTLSAIERGTVGISLFSLRRVCEILRVSSDELLFAPSEQNDAGEISEKLERLPPEQFRIADEMLHKLLEAFSVGQQPAPEE